MIPLAAAVLHSGAEDPERVLEVECGEGDGALFLAREFPRARVRGVDASAERLSPAHARGGRGAARPRRGGPLPPRRRPPPPPAVPRRPLRPPRPGGGTARGRG